MAMTSSQRERLLGMLALGSTSRTACDNLGVPYCDLLTELDESEPFRFAYLTTQATRDALTKSLGEVAE
jgi:hypothetical protein